jgi:NAD-dependent deacetylase
MLWGGPLARQDLTVSLFPLAILGCIALENALRPVFRRVGLPMLGTPALIIGWASHWVFRVFGDSLWWHPGTLPFGDWWIALAVLLVVGAIMTVSLAASVAVAAIGAAASLWSAWWYGIEGLGPASFWAFTVAPAALGGYLIVPLPRVQAAAASVIAAGIAGTVWFAWVSLPMVGILPPLLAPCLIGIWGALGLVIHRGGSLILDPGLWRLAAMLHAARRDGRPAVVLSGAGISTASGIPDYISGAWLDPSVPLSDYAFGSFTASEKCRRAYWAACARFRAVALGARANAGHRSLAALQRTGWISAIVTQNVDGLHQAAGSTGVVEIHGGIDRCRCLDCGRAGGWPSDAPWEKGDVRCRECGGRLKPAVIAMGEDIPARAMRDAERAVRSCGLLLIVGSQMAISSAASLLALARRHGAQIAFLNVGAVAQPVMAHDLFLSHRAEHALRALALLMGARFGRESAVDALPAQVVPDS